MSEIPSGQNGDSDTNTASENNTILTKYEPDFHRIFARGSLLRVDDDDEETLQIAFWSNKNTDLEMEDGKIATGYDLESEVMMTWDTAVRLRDLLDNYIDENAPERVLKSET